MKILNPIIRFAIASLIIFFPIKLFSQNVDTLTNTNSFIIGFKFSYESTGDVKTVAASKFRELINGGITLEKVINKTFGVQSGILYIRKNRNVAFDDEPANEINYNFINIRIPLLLKVKYKNLYIAGGIYSDYFIKAEATNEIYSKKFNLNTNHLNFGGIINLGIQAPLTDKVTLFLETGLSQDFTALVSNKRGLYKFLNYGVSLGSTFKL